MQNSRKNLQKDLPVDKPEEQFDKIFYNNPTDDRGETIGKKYHDEVSKIMPKKKKTK